MKLRHQFTTAHTLLDFSALGPSVAQEMLARQEKYCCTASIAAAQSDRRCPSV